MRMHDHVISSLVYSSDLRITECLRLRIKDIEFDHSSIVVHNGKTGKIERQSKMHGSFITSHAR